MTFWRRLGLSDAAASVLVLLILAFGGAAYVVAQYEKPQSTPLQPGVAGSTPEAPTVTTDIASTNEAGQETKTPAEGTTSTTVPEATATPSQDPINATEGATVVPTPVVAPSLDVVRISPDGAALIAGFSEPGSKIVFVVNGEELAKVTTDDTGNFVGFFDIPVSDTPNSIDVARVAPDGSLVADETILVAPVAAPVVVAEADIVDPTTSAGSEDEADVSDQNGSDSDAGPQTEAIADDPAPVVTENTSELAEVEDVSDEGLAQLAEVAPEVDTASQEEDVASQVQPGVAVAEEVPTPDFQDQPPSIEAPTIVIAGTQGIEVVQPAPQPQAPNRPDTANVVIDTISYDDEGEVALEGRGRTGGFIRVYLNDKPILTSPIETDGSWETPLPEVDAGVYRLRIDEISEDGNVTSRVETPFQREEIQIAAGAPPTAVTVQPGSTLWAIAQDQFGEGAEYIRVYDANRELIRDPDLIYPGQVFALPTE
ncbi:MAG: LysM peptidoglycan-binding domain-containing protein [Litoreibacter sp.]